MAETRIHYICTNRDCLADVYRDTRQETVKCGVCQTIWAPGIYSENSWAFGQEEEKNNPADKDYKDPFVKRIEKGLKRNAK